MSPPFFMQDEDLPYMLNTLKLKSVEMFQQAILYEAKLQRQNDIIAQLQQQVTELQEKLQKPTRRKTEKDGGTF